MPGQQKLLTRLKEQRAELANELVDVINTFGPKMYEDFDEVRALIFVHLRANVKFLHSGVSWFLLPGRRRPPQPTTQCYAGGRVAQP